MKLWHLTQSHFSPFVFTGRDRVWPDLEIFADFLLFVYTSTEQGQKYTEIEKKVICWVGGMISVVRWQFLQEFARSLLPDLAPDFLLTEKLLRRARGQKERNWDILVFLSPRIKISGRRFSRRVFADQWDLIIHMDIYSAELVLVTWNILSLNLPNFCCKNIQSIYCFKKDLLTTILKNSFDQSFLYNFHVWVSWFILDFLTRLPDTHPKLIVWQICDKVLKESFTQFWWMSGDLT